MNHERAVGTVHTLGARFGLASSLWWPDGVGEVAVLGADADGAWLRAPDTKPLNVYAPTRLRENASLCFHSAGAQEEFSVGIRAAPAMTANYSLNLPTSLPGGTRLLQCDSVGDLSWTATGLLSQHHDLSGLGDDDHTQYLLANGTRTAAYIRFGSYYATMGAIRLSKEDGIYSRNHARTADIRLLALTGLGDYIVVGDPNALSIGVQASTTAGLYTNAGIWELADDGVTMGFNVSSVPPGLAGSGKFRFFRYHSTLCCATETGRCTLAPARLA